MTARIFYASFAAAIFLGFFGHLYTATACFVVTNVALLVAVREGRVGGESHQGEDRTAEHESRHDCGESVEAVGGAEEGAHLDESHPHDKGREPAARLAGDVAALGGDQDQHDRDGLRDDLTLLGSDSHRTDATDGGGVA